MSLTGKTFEELKALPLEEQRAAFKLIKAVRKKMKPVSYGSQYGIGKDKLAREMRSSVTEAKKLLEEYWKRNWAIDSVVKSIRKKQIDGKWWAKNPVNGFWYRLRFEKDIWSTINQGTGAYCFDTWLAFCRSRGVTPCGQFHDEFIAPTVKGEEDKMIETLKWAEDKLNEKLKLNVHLGVSIQFGESYAKIH